MYYIWMEFYKQVIKHNIIQINIFKKISLYIFNYIFNNYIIIYLVQN